MNYSIRKLGRRIVALLCVLMTISAFVIVPSYATEEPIELQMYGVIDADSLNVRAYAAEDAPVLGELTRYSYVRVNWIEPGWVCVAYNNDGLMGYVSSEYIKVFEGPMPNRSSSAGQPAVDLAVQFLGVPYVWGGTTPAGFDCSGLMYYVYGQLGYKLYRVADDQIKKNGMAIAYEDLSPGDLVAFASSPGGTYASHIGMYVGDGIMIHAPHTGDVVKYTSIAPGTYYHSRFIGARRIIY